MQQASESIQPSIIKNVPGIHESGLSDTKQIKMSSSPHLSLMKTDLRQGLSPK